MRGTELVERLGDFRLFGDGEVLPDFSVRQFHLGGNDAVGIDGVAGMNQEIRLVLVHGGVGDHAAVVGIDAPALSGDIAAPDEADIAAVGGRGTEAANHGFADDIRMRKVAQPHPIENILPGGKILQQHLGGEVAFGQCRDRRQGARVVE